MAVGSRKPDVDVGVAATATPAGKKGAAGGGPLALVGKLAEFTKLPCGPAPGAFEPLMCSWPP